MNKAAAIMGIWVLLASVALQIMASEGYRLWEMDRELQKGEYLASIEIGAKVLRVRAVERDFIGTYPMKVSSKSKLGVLLKRAFHGAGQQVEGMMERLRDEDLRTARAQFDKLVTLRLHAEQTPLQEDAGSEDWSRWLLAGGAILEKRYADEQKWPELRALRRLLRRQGLSLPEAED
jgi:hypothetical protein